MSVKAQTDASSLPQESRRPSLMNRLPTEFGRVCHGRHTSPNQHPTVNRRSTLSGRSTVNRHSTEFGRVRRTRGHTSVCRRHGVEDDDSASAAGDTSTCEGGLCLS
jgi:hypothetical protein